MKLIPPGEQKQERVKAEPRRRVTPHSSHERYILLNCDHLTTERVQEAYAAFHSSPDSYMCEICGVESSGKPSRERIPQPDIPPF